MNPDERLKMAMANSFTKIVNFNRDFPDADFQTFIEKCMIPIIREMGYANWERDVLTDLSLATSVIVKTEISATLSE